MLFVHPMVFDDVGACEISPAEYRGKSIHLSRTASSAHALWMLRGLAATLRTSPSFSSPLHPPSPRERRHTASPSSRVPLRRVGCRCFGIGWLGFCVGGVAGSPSFPDPRWRHPREEEGRLASRLPPKRITLPSLPFSLSISSAEALAGASCLGVLRPTPGG